MPYSGYDVILHIPGFARNGAEKYGFNMREVCDMYLDIDRACHDYGVVAATPFDKWQRVLEKMQRNRRA